MKELLCSNYCFHISAEDINLLQDFIYNMSRSNSDVYHSQTDWPEERQAGMLCVFYVCVSICTVPF